jgi:hypothetical protein
MGLSSRPCLRKHPVRVEWILEAYWAEVPADHPFVATFDDRVSIGDLVKRNKAIALAVESWRRKAT